MEPEPLVIPAGALPFSVRIMERIDAFSIDRFTIARVLAEASDDNGRVMTVEEIAKKVSANEKGKSDISAIATHLGKFLNDELSKCGLRIDVQEKRRRSEVTGNLNKIPAYRLAWIMEEKKGEEVAGDESDDDGEETEE